jgi:ribosomal protein L44E
MEQTARMYCHECKEWKTDYKAVSFINFEKEEIVYTGYCPNCGCLMEHKVSIKTSIINN